MSHSTELLTELLDAADPDQIIRAVELLSAGELVAFPTETVYGLGANGLNPEAISKVFAAKGRPSDNPLILHVPSIEEALPYWQATESQVAKAHALAEEFWPGPLTLVLPAADSVPRTITAGLDSVAIRAPSNTLAQSLLKRCDFPVAAPSANLSGRPSPTSPDHVERTLDGRIAAILRGGETDIGIESTVVNLTSDLPQILRPGHVSAEALSAVVGEIDSSPVSGSAPSPGLRHRHYQPKNVAIELCSAADVLQRWEDDIGVLCLESLATKYGPRSGPTWLMPDTAENYGAALYGKLYDIEDSGVQNLLIQLPPQTSQWHAIQERLSRIAKT